MSRGWMFAAVALGGLLPLAVHGQQEEAVPPEFLYMLPPSWMREARPLEEALTRQALLTRAPVEAPRPAPAIEISMAPVGEMIISCSLVLPSEGLFPHVEPSSELVMLVLEPIEAPRPVK